MEEMLLTTSYFPNILSVSSTYLALCGRCSSDQAQALFGLFTFVTPAKHWGYDSRRKIGMHYCQTYYHPRLIRLVTCKMKISIKDVTH